MQSEHPATWLHLLYHKMQGFLIASHDFQVCKMLLLTNANPCPVREQINSSTENFCADTCNNSKARGIAACRTPIYLMGGLLSFTPPAFLYQEYRDSSKQQEIEQRRQRENLSPEVMGGTVAESGVMSPPVLQLQLRNSARSLSLWQNLEAVQASGLLTQLAHKEIIMQEVSS